jgi:hypothetical protein
MRPDKARGRTPLGPTSPNTPPAATQAGALVLTLPRPGDNAPKARLRRLRAALAGTGLEDRTRDLAALPAARVVPDE